MVLVTHSDSAVIPPDVYLRMRAFLASSVPRLVVNGDRNGIRTKVISKLESTIRHRRNWSALTLLSEAGITITAGLANELASLNFAGTA